MRDPLEEALAGFSPEAGSEARDLAEICSIVPGSDPFGRDLPFHLTASAFVVAPEAGEVLLRYHPRFRRFMQVGGHGDPGERNPHLVARREAEEETGLLDLTALPSKRPPALVQVVVVDVPASATEPAHRHGDLRYVLSTQHPSLARPEEEGAPLRWLSVDLATSFVEEPNLVTGLRRVAALLRGDRPER